VNVKNELIFSGSERVYHIMSAKSWKDYLLSSGLHLWHSVAQALDKLGIYNHKEFKYERTNEIGLPQVFSVDIFASHINLELQIWLELFVECKYRHEGVRWLFVPAKTELFFGPQLGDCFILLDELSSDREINRGVLDQFTSAYDFCGKGVELLSNDANPKAVEQSIQQLRFALVNSIVDGLNHQLHGSIPSERTPIFVIVPIVVTTAELWRLNQDVSIESIREADVLEQVATQRDLLIMRQEPDIQLTRHAISVFEKNITAADQVLISERIKPVITRGYPGLLHKYSHASPSQFVIIHFSKFEKAMKNLLSFIAQPTLVARRTPP
jgi:hypothetical protein